MGYFTGARGALPPRFAAGVRLRVDNGGTYLGSLTSFIQSRYPSYQPTTTTPTTTTTTAPKLPTVGFTTPYVQPAPAPAPVTKISFSPAPAPTPTPVSVPGGVYSSPSGPTVYEPPPPAVQPNDPVTPAVQAAAPIVGAIDPAAGAAAALIPAFTQAASAGPNTQIRFTDDMTMPDAQPELYNADGTPITTAAKAATLVDKIKSLPPAAKVGGAIALYLLFARR